MGANGTFSGDLVLFLGDLNCDGSVGFGDINLFVRRVSDGVLYGCCSPECGGPCPQEGEGRRMDGFPGEESGPLPPEEMAALLAENVDPADHDSLLARLAEFITGQQAPDEAAYWEAVYDALVQ